MIKSLPERIMPSGMVSQERITKTSHHIQWQPRHEAATAVHRRQRSGSRTRLWLEPESYGVIGLMLEMTSLGVWQSRLRRAFYSQSKVDVAAWDRLCGEAQIVTCPPPQTYWSSKKSSLLT